MGMPGMIIGVQEVIIPSSLGAGKAKVFRAVHLHQYAVQTVSFNVCTMSGKSLGTTHLINEYIFLSTPNGNYGKV